MAFLRIGEMEPRELAGASRGFGLGYKEPFLSGILNVGTLALALRLWAAPMLTRAFGGLRSTFSRLLDPTNFGAGDKSRFFDYYSEIPTILLLLLRLFTGPRFTISGRVVLGDRSPFFLLLLLLLLF